MSISMANKLYEPIQQVGTISEDVKAIQRDSENKLYMVLYFNIDEESFKFKKFTGRYNAYFGIKDLVETENIDIRNSEVLVELVGIDSNTNKARRYIMHPDEALSIIDFCHQVEGLFGDKAWNVDDYDTDYDGPDEVEDIADFKRSFNNNTVLEEIDSIRGVSRFITSPIDTNEDKKEV